MLSRLTASFWRYKLAARWPGTRGRSSFVTAGRLSPGRCLASGRGGQRSSSALLLVDDDDEDTEVGFDEAQTVDSKSDLTVSELATSLCSGEEDKLDPALSRLAMLNADRKRKICAAVQRRRPSTRSVDTLVSRIGALACIEQPRLRRRASPTSALAVLEAFESQSVFRLHDSPAKEQTRQPLGASVPVLKPSSKAIGELVVGLAQGDALIGDIYDIFEAWRAHPLDVKAEALVEVHQRGNTPTQLAVPSSREKRNEDVSLEHLKETVRVYRAVIKSLGDNGLQHRALQLYEHMCTINGVHVRDAECRHALLDISVSAGDAEGAFSAQFGDDDVETDLKERCAPEPNGSSALSWLRDERLSAEDIRRILQRAQKRPELAASVATERRSGTLALAYAREGDAKAARKALRTQPAPSTIAAVHVLSSLDDVGGALKALKRSQGKLADFEQHEVHQAVCALASASFDNDDVPTAIHVLSGHKDRVHTERSLHRKSPLPYDETMESALPVPGDDTNVWTALLCAALHADNALGFALATDELSRRQVHWSPKMTQRVAVKMLSNMNVAMELAQMRDRGRPLSLECIALMNIAAGHSPQPPLKDGILHDPLVPQKVKQRSRNRKLFTFRMRSESFAGAQSMTLYERKRMLSQLYSERNRQRKWQKFTRTPALETSA